MDPVTGQVDILTTDLAYAEQTKTFVLTATSRESGFAVSDTFTVYFRNKCWSSTLTAAVFTQASWTYDLL